MSPQERLFEAVKTDDLEKAKEAVLSGADVNARLPYSSDTPLHRTKSIQIAKLLIENEANIEKEDSLGETPLLKDYSDEIKELLILKGAKDREKKNKQIEIPTKNE